MDSRKPQNPQEMERRLGALEALVEDLGGRVAVLEGRPHSPAAELPAATAEEPAEASQATSPDADERSRPASTGTSVAVLIGRTCVMLGGAFLLRALTLESDSLPTAVGVAMGLTYAALPLGLAHRAAGRGRRLDGVFHAVTSALIAFPLIWEGTQRLDVLSPLSSAGAALAFGGIGLYVAWRHSLRAIVWLAPVAAVATAAALLLSTGAVPPFAVVLLVLAAASLAASYNRGWRPLRWSVALALDATAIVATLPRFAAALDPVLVGAFQLALAVVYLASFAVRTLGLRARAGPFVVTQSVVVLVIAFEAAPRLLVPAGVPTAVFGAGALVLLVGATVAAFLERAREDRVNVACFIALAALMAIEGFRYLLPPQVAAVGWSVLAVIAAWFGRKPSRVALRGSVAALSLAALAGSGGLGYIARTLTAGIGSPWAPPAVAVYPVLAAIVLALIFLRLSRPAGAGPEASWTGTGYVLSLSLALGVAALIIGGLAGALAGAPWFLGDPGALAALRTGALTLCLWALVVGARVLDLADLRWAAYTLLGVLVVKIVLDDLLRGRPATLFITFVLFGATLMLLPYALRRPRAEAPEAASGEEPDGDDDEETAT